MNRALVLLLAVIGGAAGALAILMGFTAVLMGTLWIFVFGDDPWPSWVEPVLNVAIPIAGLFLWLRVGWLIWRRLLALHPEG